MPTEILRNTAATDEQIVAKIQDLGSVGDNTDGIVTDAVGNLYITDVARNGIVKFDPKSRVMSLLAVAEAIRWPDTPAIQPGGDLIFTSSSLNDHFAGTVKRGEERYDLWRLPLSGRVAKAG